MTQIDSGSGEAGRPTAREPWYRRWQTELADTMIGAVMGDEPQIRLIGPRPTRQVTFAVFDVTIGSRHLWAWCQMGGGPGFDDITCTETDGMTFVDLPPNLVLGKHLFTITTTREESL